MPDHCAASGGSAAAALGGALLLAARNGLYGVSLSTTIEGRLPRRLLAAQLVIDEPALRARAGADFATEVPDSAREGTRLHLFRRFAVRP